jgi:hypothetical protein
MGKSSVVIRKFLVILGWGRMLQGALKRSIKLMGKV